MQTKFIILSHGRAGTTYLCAALSDHPHIKAYQEVFHESVDERDPIAGRVYQADEDAGVFLRDVVFADPNEFGKRIVGCKILFFHSRASRSQFNAWNYLLADRDVRVIQIQRQNLFEAFVSLLRARRTSTWWVDHGDQLPPSHNSPIFVDPSECKQYMERTAAEIAWATATFAGHPRLMISYEDLRDRLSDTMDSIYRFLGEQPLPENPPFIRLNVSPGPEGVENYDQLLSAFRYSIFRDYFETDSTTTPTRDASGPPARRGIINTGSLTKTESNGHQRSDSTSVDPLSGNRLGPAPGGAAKFLLLLGASTSQANLLCQSRISGDGPEKNIVVDDVVEDLRYYTDDELQDADLISGHVGYALRHRVGRDRRCIAVLADPMNRTIAEYFKWKSYPDHPLGRVANALSIYEFAASNDPAVIERFDNAQTWQFFWDNSTVARRKFAALTPEAVLTRAKENLAACDFFGVEEDLPGLVSCLKNCFDWLWIPDPVTAGGAAQLAVTSDLDLDLLRDRLGCRLKLDYELYACAMRLYADRRSMALSVV